MEENWRAFLAQYDKSFLRQAYEYAYKFSKDPSTQVGAVLVKNGVILTSGVNGFPPGVAETEERWQRPLKYDFAEHAERRCIYDAARKGLSTAGTTMYMPWFPCPECARAINLAGIEELVGHKSMIDMDQERWAEKLGIAMVILKESRVRFRQVEGKIFAPEENFQLRFNGQLWSP